MTNSTTVTGQEKGHAPASVARPGVGLIGTTESVLAILRELYADTMVEAYLSLPGDEAMGPAFGKMMGAMESLGVTREHLEDACEAVDNKLKPVGYSLIARVTLAHRLALELAARRLMAGASGGRSPSRYTFSADEVQHELSVIDNLVFGRDILPKPVWFQQPDYLI